MAPHLTITLIGSDQDDGAVQFSDFRGFCDTLAHCLRRVEEIVAGGSKLRYRLVELKSGSAVFTLEPVPLPHGADPSAEVIGGFVETVRRIQEGEQVSAKFGGTDLEAFRHLAEPVSKRLAGMMIAGINITTQYIANIDKILKSTIPSEGFVKGRLERLNLHNCREFAIYPPVLGQSIVCSFPEEMFPQVYEAVNRRSITVFGTLHFRPDRAFPDRVQVKTMEIHPPDDELPSLVSLRGTWAGCTEGFTTLEFIKKIRDE